MSEPPLQITGLGHRYSALPVLASVSLTIQAGELVAALGPSGCGKTTLLRAIAGLLTPDTGRIAVGGVTVVEGGQERVPVERRRVGLVFQEYALFPHMSVADNVGFALPRGQRRQRVAALLELAGLAGLADRKPAALSGGQQQRVALIRALAPRPHLLLLDEPFANVDAERRRTLGAELRRLIQAEGAAAMLVTHDRADALRLSDRVLAITPRPGGASITQDASPQHLYRRPCDAAVARLTGPAWFLDGQGEGAIAQTTLGSLPLLAPVHGPVRLLIRPEQARLLPEPAGPHRVLQQHFVGRGWLLDCRTDAGTITVEAAAPSARGRVVIDGPVWALPAGR